jgi:hypothetical protein
LQQGVYATFTPEPTRNALLWTAVLRAWTGALSHQSAAELFGFADAQRQLIHVTDTAARHPARDRQIPGVIVHRSNRVVFACNPVLRPPRTRRRGGTRWPAAHPVARRFEDIRRDNANAAAAKKHPTDHGLFLLNLADYDP